MKDGDKRMMMRKDDEKRREKREMRITKIRGVFKRLERCMASCQPGGRFII